MNELRPSEMLMGFEGRNVIIWMRNGTTIKGVLEKSAKYDIIVSVLHRPVIILKHAIDKVELSDR